MPLQVFCRNCAQYRNEWCKLKVDSPDPDMVHDCQYYRGMTNADRIRNMTDEELADELLEWFACFMAVEWSRDMVLDLLKEEAE